MPVSQLCKSLIHSCCSVACSSFKDTVSCYIHVTMLILDHFMPLIVLVWSASSYVHSAIFTKPWLPWWLRWQSVCLQCGRPGFDPWVWKIPWRRKWQPTPVLLPGKSHEWRSLVGYSPWGAESDTTEWLHFHFSYTHVLSLPLTGREEGSFYVCSAPCINSLVMSLLP